MEKLFQVKGSQVKRFQDVPSQTSSEQCKSKVSNFRQLESTCLFCYLDDFLVFQF